MEKQLVVKKDGVIQVTTFDERWYMKPVPDEETGLTEYIPYPSVTWISGYYPKGKYFYRYIGQVGYEEAEKRLAEAGAKGTKIHLAAADVLQGREVKMESKYLDKQTGESTDLTGEEYYAIMTLEQWLDKIDIEVIGIELHGFHHDPNYAGTADLVCRIKNKEDKWDLWIIDFKTGLNLYPSHEIQISAYGHLEFDLRKLGVTKKEWNNKRLGILQLGYTRNKIKHYKLTEIEDQYDLFSTSVYKIWENECSGIKPHQREYPESIKVDLKGKKLVGFMEEGEVPFAEEPTE